MRIRAYFRLKTDTLVSRRPVGRRIVDAIRAGRVLEAIKLQSIRGNIPPAGILRSLQLPM